MFERRRFESRSLQRRVHCEPDFLSLAWRASSRPDGGSAISTARSERRSPPGP